jgi:hypothetical protein
MLNIYNVRYQSLLGLYHKSNSHKFNLFYWLVLTVKPQSSPSIAKEIIIFNIIWTQSKFNLKMH